MQAPLESTLPPAPTRPPRLPTLTQCWCRTSHTSGAWVGWPGPWRWAGRPGGSASWAGRQARHLGGGGAHRHIRARPRSSSIQAVYLRTLCLLQHAEATHRYRRTDGGGGAGGGALWSNTGHESEDRRKRVITPDLWLGPGQGRKAELARAKAPTVHTECPTWQAKQTFRLARPSHDDINGG